MKLTKLFLVFLAGCFSLTAMTSSAQEPAKKELLAGQLLDLLQMQKMMDATFNAIPKMQQQMMASQNLPAEQQEKVNKQIQDSIQIVKKELGWDTIKPIFVKIYAGNFDETELQGLINFYKTSVGRAWIDKQPAIQDATMQAMSEIMPKIQAAMMKAMAQSNNQATPSPAATP